MRTRRLRGASRSVSSRASGIHAGKRPDDEYIFKLGTHEPLIISELGIKTYE